MPPRQYTIHVEQRHGWASIQTMRASAANGSADVWRYADENVGNFPIFSFGKHTQERRRRKKTALYSWFLKQTMYYSCRREWTLPASRCWMARKPAEREEREWERRLWGEKRQTNRLGERKESFYSHIGERLNCRKNIEGEGAAWGWLPPRRGNTTWENVLRKSTSPWREMLTTLTGHSVKLVQLQSASTRGQCRLKYLQIYIYIYIYI